MGYRSVDLPETAREIPRAAYVHLPFCRQRCGYCNFTLIANRDDLIEQYLIALDTELRSFDHCRPVDTLFIGGGTPTYPAPDKLEHLLDLVNVWFSLNSGAEYSVEANPCDITESKVAILSAAGVTRVSLGAQSFNQKKLRALDRSHTEEDIVNAVNLLRKYRLHVSIDLIFGVPNETFEVWEADLEKAIQLAPDHLSTYGLTYEKGAFFYSQMLRGKLTPIGEDLELRMYQHSIETLKEFGFDHYEVSNFSRPGHRCRHNEGYWKLQGHFAVGAGASRFVCGTRETNHRSTTTYMKRLLAGESPVAFREHLSAEATARETVVFGLRQIDGIAISDFYESTGFDIFKLLKKPLDRFIDQGFLSLENNRLRLTQKGLYVSDSLWPDFLIE